MSEVLISADKAGHWYQAGTGRPIFEVPYADPSKGMRSTTKADARKLGLLPSVTGINGVVRKPQLESWIQTQIVLAALTLPQNIGESHDDFARRVVRDSGEEGRNAADFGTRVHSLVEGYLRSGSFSFDISGYESQFLDGFAHWAERVSLVPTTLEKTFGSQEEGYGGTVDFIGSAMGISVMIDWKTQKSKPDKPMTFYPEYPTQLVAYKRGLRLEDQMLMSVVISSTEPGRIETFTWLDEKEYWKRFKAKRHIFYSPEGAGYGLPVGDWYNEG